MTLASLYEWLMLAHVVGAMVWLGGLVALSALAWRVTMTADDPAAGRFAAALGVLGPLVFLPALLVVLGFGMGMVADTDEWSFGQTWIWLALVLFGVAFVIGAAFQSRAGIAARRAGDAGDLGEAVHQLRRWLVGAVLILGVLVVVTWDMVFKPG